MPTGEPCISRSASLELADYSQVDMLSLRCKSVNFGAEITLVRPNQAEAESDLADACEEGACRGNEWTH